MKRWIYSLAMSRMVVLVMLMGWEPFQASAQDGQCLEHARYIYALFEANEGDRIHAALSEEVRQKSTPELFHDLLPKIEKQFGALQSAGDWHEGEMQDCTFCYRDLTLERYRLRFQLSFNVRRELIGLWLKPVPVSTATPSTLYNIETMAERELTLGADGFELPGTLTLPQNASPDRRVPCMILVHGSGPHDRDETLGPNKPFRDLAWGLAERGVATIRYDKRTKVYGAACVPSGRELDYDVETVDDAMAAVSWARKQPELAADSIYILGHSLGAMLAPRMAERDSTLAGIVLLAAPVRSLEDLLVEQVGYLNSLTGNSAEAKAQLEQLKLQVANVKRLDSMDFDPSIPLPMGLPASYWRLNNRYRPAEVAARLKLPILVLQGERDYQVTMLDFGLWRINLMRSKNAFFKSYPKLNHLMQEGVGKSTPLEYQEAAPVPAYLMDDVTRFVHTGRLE